MSVDWSKPIEAVHEDGRVKTVFLVRKDYDGDYQISPPLVPERSQGKYFRHDGRPTYGDNESVRPWHIRNVAPVQPAIAPELITRMANAISRHVSGKTELFDAQEGPNCTVEAEFRAIVAELPKPVDVDMLAAREIASEWLMALVASAEQIAAGEIAKGERDDAIVVHVARAAIAKGRQLEREGK